MTNSLHYIDLFAGCGGLSTGLHLAGWKGLFAIERNASAFGTLTANLIQKRHHFNWPNWLSKNPWDINKLLEEKSSELMALRGKVDLIAGGPPCQGFSMAGRRRESDQRNKLIFSYLNVVRLIQPRAILFENVRGFTMRFKAHQRTDEAYSSQVIEQLKQLGYTDARGKIIDMSKFGVPQQRLRYIVIATREGKAEEIFQQLEKQSKTFLDARNIPTSNTAQEALSDLEQRHGEVSCPDSPKFNSGIAGTPLTGYQRYIRQSNARYVPNSHRFVKHTPKVEEVFRRMLLSAPRNKTIAGDARIQFGLKKRSAKVLKADMPAPTVTTIPDDFIHYSEPRVMTVRECARLQTFPDWFEFKGPYTTGGNRRIHEAPRYTQVGNAVPPLFAEMIGLVVKEALENV